MEDLLDFVDLHNSEAKNQIGSFSIERFTKSSKFVTLMAEIKPVVTAKRGFENRNKSIIITFC